MLIMFEFLLGSDELLQDQSLDVTPRLGVSVILQFLYLVYAFSLRLLFLQLCSNRCADGLVQDV